MKIEPTIVIDSREQTPWAFANLPTEPGTLATADYSIRGLTHLITVERKSLSDLLGCVGSGRARFKRELKRLAAYRFRTVVVETSAETIAAGEWRGHLKPAHVWGALASWSGFFGVGFMLAGNATLAAEFAERFLRLAAETVAAENRALGVKEQQEAAA